jgi:hypothetical protein
MTMADSNMMLEFRKRTDRILNVENEKNQLIEVGQQCCQLSVVLTRARRIFFTDSISVRSWLNNTVWITTEKQTTTARAN